MKKMRSLYMLMILCVFIVSCEEDDTDNLSFVTSYPVFEVTGGNVLSVIKSGGAFADPGVKARENGAEIPVVVTGTVDQSTPGFYRLTYSAVNSDGYSGTTSRLVFVTNEDVSDADISGTYKRAANGRLSTVTKVADGVFLMTDCWGSATSGGQPLPVPTYLLNTDGNNLLLGYSEAGAPFNGNTGTGTFSPTELVLNVTLIGPGAVRTNTWAKQ